MLPGKTSSSSAPARNPSPRVWMGARVRNIADEGERSAFGLPSVSGVLVLEILPTSSLNRSGLKKNDVILSLNGTNIPDVATLMQSSRDLPPGQILSLAIARDQKELTVKVTR